MFKSVRKNIEKKNSETLKKILLCGIVTTSLMICSGVAFAADGDVTDETEDASITDETEDATTTDETESVTITDEDLDSSSDENEDFYSGNEVEFYEDHMILNGERYNKGDSVTINGKTYTYDENFIPSHSNSFIGGSGSFTEASYNKITFNGIESHIDISGGTFPGKLYQNEFTFNDSILELNFSNADDYQLNFDSNTFTINGGTHSNSYISMPNVTSTNNTVNISGSPDLSDFYIYSNYFGDAGTTSGNTLNLYSSGLTAKNIYGFENLNFRIPEDTTSGVTMLTLTDGSTSIDNTAITAYISGGSTLSTGDYVNLISNSNGLTGSPSSSNVKFAEGVTLLYDANISNDGNNWVMTLGDAIVNEDSKAAAQALDNTNDVVASGTERIMDWLPPEELEEAVADANADNVDTGAVAGQIAAVINKSFGVFASMDGGKLKTKTGNGSYIKTKPAGIDLGFARAVESQSGNTWVFAPLLDYGKADFDSYLPNGTHGTGNSKYFSGGLIGRRIQKNGFYYEASFRGGKSTTDFSFTSEVLKNYNAPNVIGYHATAPVFAGHIRLGKLMRLNKNNLLHVYGIYAHNHINGISADLTTGERYDFDAVDSGTFRLGYKLTTRVSKLSKIYTGLAYQYEFNGGTSAKYRDYTTAESEVKGSSAMIELGWQLHANKKSAWVVDFNVTGWAGIQQGVTATAKMKKSF